MKALYRIVGRARITFLASLVIVPLVVFVPVGGVAFVRLGALDADVKSIVGERASLNALRTFVELSTSIILFRDFIASGSGDFGTAAHRVDSDMNRSLEAAKHEDPTTGASLKKVSISWWYAKRGRHLEQATHLVELVEDSLGTGLDGSDLPNDPDRAVRTLSTISTSDIPMLRAQMHQVSTTLIATLRRRTLNFKERVNAATVVTQAQTRVATIVDSFGIAGRSSTDVQNAASNNARYLREAFDPLLATINDVVTNDRPSESNTRQAERLASEFGRADGQLNSLSARSFDETQMLLGKRNERAAKQLLLAQLAFLFVFGCACWLVFFLVGFAVRKAKTIGKREDEERAREAERDAQIKKEKALSQTTAFRGIVMEKSPIGIAVVDAAGAIYDANPKMIEIVGSNDFNIVGGYKEQYQALARGSIKRLDFERAFLQDGGRLVHAEISISAIEVDKRPLHLCMLRDITERKEVESRLNYEATHDGLTKLANRNRFRSELGATISRSRERGETFAVLFIDLDLFKYVNDTYGHAAGDFVLQTVSGRLVDIVNDLDLVARFGGDEFAILLAAPAEIARAERISQAIVASLAEPIMWGDQTVNIGSSIGLALGPTGADNAEELMRNADTAMYSAKQLGRGRYVIFDPAMQEAAHKSAQLANDLQTALQDDTQIHLLYQPIVDVRNNEILGFEALARWNHPVFGEIARDVFVKVAEQSGAIRNLGRYVLRAACIQLNEMSERLPSALQTTLSVNISPSELATPNFVESVVDVIRTTDFDPRRLYLEITENIMIANGDQANRIMSRLREFGIRISIDDFGSGYSSLRYLQELHIDLLKIDKGFLHNRPDDDSGRTILRAIANLAKSFHLPVVAEGIETSDHLQLVRAIGCEYGQGKLWGEPMSIVEIERRLRGRQSKIN